MCCFSKEAQVAATNIFARPSKGYGQYLVYSMTLKAKEERPDPADPNVEGEQGGRRLVH
jgi:hypothetical protein